MFHNYLSIHSAAPSYEYFVQRARQWMLKNVVLERKKLSVTKLKELKKLNDKLQKNIMMDMEYTQNRKELILHAELISACWHTLFIDIQWSQNNSQLRQYSQDSLPPISYLIS